MVEYKLNMIFLQKKRFKRLLTGGLMLFFMLLKRQMSGQWEFFLFGEKKSWRLMILFMAYVFWWWWVGAWGVKRLHSICYVCMYMRLWIKYEERGTVGFNVAKGTIRGANGVYLGILILLKVRRKGKGLGIIPGEKKYSLFGDFLGVNEGGGFTFNW